jgi:glycosyltransferase involved in cell wall biosynthesis
LVKQQLTEGKEYFLYVGAIHPRKNLINLLKGFSWFKKRYQSNMKLVLVGRMAWKNEMFLKQLESYKYRNDVVVAGYVEEQKLQEIVDLLEVDLLEEEYEDDDYEDDEDISSIGSDGYESDDDFMIVAPGARIVDEDDAKDEKKMRENLSAALDREAKGGKRKCTMCKNKKYKKRKDTNKKTKKNKKRKTSKKSKQSKRKSKSKKLRGG